MVIGVHSGLELIYNLNWDFLHVILHILCSGLDITQCLTWGKKKRKPSRRICKPSQETVQ